MSFDPSSVDLSFVEPALRAEVLRRIEVLEEFVCSRGPAARRKACEALGLKLPQLYVLAKAWRARGRAEDVTLRSTRKVRPGGLSDEMQTEIERLVDAYPDANTLEIVEKVETFAKQVGVLAPRYPTVSKYVRERKAVTGRRTLAGLGHDVMIDVTVSDIAALSGDDWIRPHVITVVDAGLAQLVGIAGTVGAVGPADVARAIADTVERDLHLLEMGNTPPSIQPINISMPSALAAGWDRLSVALEDAGAKLKVHELRVHKCGTATTALFGTTWATYKIRPRLVCRDVDARRVVDRHRDAVPLDEAISYLGAIAMEGCEPALSPFARLGRSALGRLAISLDEIVQRHG